MLAFNCEKWQEKRIEFKYLLYAMVLLVRCCDNIKMNNTIIASNVRISQRLKTSQAAHYILALDANANKECMKYLFIKVVGTNNNN